MVVVDEKILYDESKLDKDSFRSSDSSKEVSIDYKSCGWKKTAGLLFSEYICLAIMSFPMSYATLGLVPGLIITVFVSLTVLYTGLTITDYCIRYPEVTNICDIGQNLFGYRWAWYATALCFLLNNTLIQSLHVLVSAKYFNTISDNSTICSIVFSVVGVIICFLLSLPRTFASMSFIGYFAAATMFIAVLLSMIFVGIQDHPNNYQPGVPVTWHLWPVDGTTYVAAMGATLNIIYTFVGQITYPSFIAEMKEPRDFKKALYLVTLCELITFGLAGCIVYVYVGNTYVTSPAFGSLVGNYKKIAFSFALPTVLFLGALYGNVSSQFLFFLIFKNDNNHIYNHTFKGWSVWTLLNLGLWILAFIISESIPFFSDLLSLMCSLFDCWFGFVFWGVAFFRLRAERTTGSALTLKEGSLWDKFQVFFNILLIIIGVYILGPGLYATVQSIILSYEESLYGSAFSCTSNGI